MKIGVFTDTHGNYLALNAITKYFKEEKCDEVIHCGDMLCMGGQSKECLDYFLSSNVVLILGNHDRGYVRNATQQTGESQVKQEHKEFIYASLGEQYKEKISKLPLMVYRNYSGLKVAFTHYALSKDPRYTWLPINQYPDAAFFDEAFDTVDADLIIFGHKHEPCDIVGKKRYIDIGSVGCHKDNFARGIILEINDKGNYEIRQIEVPYDRDKVYEIMLERKVPDSRHIFDYYFKDSENNK